MKTLIFIVLLIPLLASAQTKEYRIVYNGKTTITMFEATDKDITRTHYTLLRGDAKVVTDKVDSDALTKTAEYAIIKAIALTISEAPKEEPIEKPTDKIKEVIK